MDVDTSEAVSKVAMPGSRFYLLRPRGFGKTQLLSELATLLRGGKGAKDHFAGRWLGQNRPALLRQPQLPVLQLDIRAAAQSPDPEADLISQLMTAAEQEVGAPTLVGRPPSDIESALETATRGVNKARRAKVALLVDDYDIGGAAELVVQNMLRKAVAMHASSDAIGFVMATGSHRLSTFRDVLSDMRDLTMDLNQSSAAGLTHNQMAVCLGLEEGPPTPPYKGVPTDDASASTPRRRYSWDSKRQEAVFAGVEQSLDASQDDARTWASAAQTSAEAEARRRFITVTNERGGHWFGGVLPDGSAELCLPRSDEPISSPFGAPATDREWKLVADSLFEYRELEGYTRAHMPPEAAADGADPDPFGWPAALLQSGVMSLSRRKVVFHEFHTDAWVRLRVANARARQWLLAELCSTNELDPTVAQSALDALSAEIAGGSMAAVRDAAERVRAVAATGATGDFGTLCELLLSCVDGVEVSDEATTTRTQVDTSDGVAYFPASVDVDGALTMGCCAYLVNRVPPAPQPLPKDCFRVERLEEGL